MSLRLMETYATLNVRPITCWLNATPLFPASETKEVGIPIDHASGAVKDTPLYDTRKDPASHAGRRRTTSAPVCGAS